jgi:hypothetical protein
MNRLWLRLYPRSWRAVYGSEIASQLKDTPTRLATVLDVMRGAMDAWLHPKLVVALGSGIRPRGWGHMSGVAAVLVFAVIVGTGVSVIEAHRPPLRGTGSSSEVVPTADQTGMITAEPYCPSSSHNCLLSTSLIQQVGGRLRRPLPFKPNSRVPRIVSANTDPLVTVPLRNLGTAPETLGYDVFITKREPALIRAVGDIAPSQWLDEVKWRGVVWDLAHVDSARSRPVRLAAGQQAQMAVAWPGTRESGRRARPGSYWVVVWGSANGRPVGLYYWPIILR